MLSLCCCWLRTVSCSRCRNIWSSSRFLGLILQMTWHDIVLTQPLVSPDPAPAWLPGAAPHVAPVPDVPDGGHPRVAGHQVHTHIACVSHVTWPHVTTCHQLTSPAPLPGLVTRAYSPLGMEGSALWQTLLVPDAPTVEILAEKMGVPINVSDKVTL